MNNDPNIMRDAMLNRMDAAALRPVRIQTFIDAVTTLDVFLAAYREQPDSKPLLDEDDLLTFGDLRAILASFTASGDAA